MKLENLLINKTALIEGFSKRKRYWTFILSSSIFLAAASVFIVTKLSHTYTLAVNYTPSIPYEVFLLSRNIEDSDFKRFAIFEFKSPVSHYKTILKGESLTKRLGCIPGDTLKVVGRDYYCNEYYMGRALKLDSSKRPINRQFIYNGIIGKDNYFVLGDHSNSFDSRYYGFIKKENFTGVSRWER